LDAIPKIFDVLNLCTDANLVTFYQQVRLLKYLMMKPQLQKARRFQSIAQLCGIVEDLKTDIPTDSDWPSVTMDALRNVAGKVPSDLVYTTDDVHDDECGTDSEISSCDLEDVSSYGTAYEAFGGGKKGKEACDAIAALWETRSIDSLTSNFIVLL
jgi:DNA polymerase-1